jgi:hypothetical protein
MFPRGILPFLMLSIGIPACQMGLRPDSIPAPCVPLSDPQNVPLAGGTRFPSRLSWQCTEPGSASSSGTSWLIHADDARSFSRLVTTTSTLSRRSLSCLERPPKRSAATEIGCERIKSQSLHSMEITRKALSCSDVCSLLATPTRK